MGIEDYWTVISEVFPSSINYSAIGTKMVFDHVMLDLNHVLYHVGSFCSDEVQIDAILDHLDYLLTQFPARKSIFVALDGPGPRAKFLVQRDRRERSADRNPESNSLKYTPGSEFMLKLQVALFSWAAERATRYASVKIFLSGADREGEGELKIYQHLLNIEQIQDMSSIASTKAPAASSQKESVLLLGTDSDLVASSFRLQIIKNIHVAVGRMIAWKQHQVLDLEKLHSIMMGDLVGEPLRIIDDVTFLSLLAGSDYAPRLLGYSLKRALLWYRNYKAQPSNEMKYIISRTLDETTGQTAAWEVHAALLKEVISAADHSRLTYDVLAAKVNGKEKSISLSRLDPKSTLNSLAASLVRKCQIVYENSRVSATQQGVAGSAKLAEKEAAHAALSIQGPFFQRVCRESLDDAALRDLETYLSCITDLATASSASMPPTSDPEISFYVTLSPTAPSSRSLTLDAKMVESNKQNQILLQASRMANQPAVVLEYLRMLIWTVEYYQGNCRGYNDAYGFASAPSCEGMKRLLPKRVSITVQDNRVLSPDSTLNPLQTNTVSHEKPLLPLAFFTALMPPISIASKALPEPVRDAVLEYRSSRNLNIIDFTIDEASNGIAIKDHSDDFIAQMVSNVPEITSHIDFQHLTTFSPSYVFFQAENVVDPDLQRSKLDLSSLNSSRYAWSNVKKRLKQLETVDTSRVVCLAEEPASQRDRIRRFAVIQNRFMQKRHFHSISSKKSIIRHQRSSISIQKILGCILKRL